MVLDIRRESGANISINTLYEHPSLAAFSAQVDMQRGPTKMVNGDGAEAKEKDVTYTQSLDELLQQLPTRYQTADPATMRASAKPTVFLTGATGLLGTCMIKDILERSSRALKLICHVRSVKDPTRCVAARANPAHAHGASRRAARGSSSKFIDRSPETAGHNTCEYRRRDRTWWIDSGDVKRSGKPRVVASRARRILPARSHRHDRPHLLAVPRRRTPLRRPTLRCSIRRSPRCLESVDAAPYTISHHCSSRRARRSCVRPIARRPYGRPREARAEGERLPPHDQGRR